MGDMVKSGYDCRIVNFADLKVGDRFMFPRGTCQEYDVWDKDCGVKPDIVVPRDADSFADYLTEYSRVIVREED